LELQRSLEKEKLSGFATPADKDFAQLVSENILGVQASKHR
jgi:hypothetical protein